MKVNICGIPFNVIECEDSFTFDAVHFGEIEYKECRIKINSGMTPELKKEVLCHEMMHGILLHTGYYKESQDENFVQALGNAIAQSFDIKMEDEPCENHS